jgi:hypothetical protein
MFGFVNSDPDTSQRGRFFLFYTYDGISGGAVLGALVAGDAAIAFEETSQEQSVADLMTLLRSIFSPEKVHVPDPLEVGGYMLEKDLICLADQNHWPTQPLLRPSGALQTKNPCTKDPEGQAVHAAGFVATDICAWLCCYRCPCGFLDKMAYYQVTTCLSLPVLLPSLW